MHQRTAYLGVRVLVVDGIVGFCQMLADLLDGLPLLLAVCDAGFCFDQCSACRTNHADCTYLHKMVNDERPGWVGFYGNLYGNLHLAYRRPVRRVRVVMMITYHHGNLCLAYRRPVRRVRVMMPYHMTIPTGNPRCPITQRFLLGIHDALHNASYW